MRLGEGADNDSGPKQKKYRIGANNLLRALSICSIEEEPMAEDNLEGVQELSSHSQSGQEVRMMAFYLKQLAGGRMNGTPFTSDTYTQSKVTVAGKLCDLLDCVVDVVQEECWDWGGGTLMRVRVFFLRLVPHRLMS